MEKSARRIISILVFISLIMAWYLLSIIINNSLFIPTPVETVEMLITLLKGNLLSHVWASFRRITIAVFIAGAVSIPLGMIIAKVLVITDVIHWYWRGYESFSYFYCSIFAIFANCGT